MVAVGPQWIPTRDRLMEAARQGVPVEQRILGTEADHVPPQGIQLVRCTNVLLEGISFRNSSSTAVHPVYCDSVLIRGVTIDSPGPNEGINLDSCRNVIVEDCRIAVGDDGIALKSGRNEDGWRVGKPTENVVIRRCQMQGGRGALAIGSEMSGGVRNVLIEDCSASGSYWGVHLKSQEGRGGVVENVWIRDLTTENLPGAPLWVSALYNQGIEVTTGPAPLFRNLHFRNITCHGAAYAGRIQGLKGVPVQEITLEGLSITADVGLQLYNARQVRLSNVEIASSTQPITMAGTQKISFTDARDLGTVDFQDFLLDSPVGQSAWYRLRATRDGLLTVAGTSASGLPDNATLTLFASGQSQAVETQASGQGRLDCQAIAGKEYYLLVEPAAAGLQLVAANLVQQAGTSVFVHGTSEADSFDIDAAGPYRVSINGLTYQWQAREIDVLAIDGGAGADAAVLHGTPGDDNLSASPGAAILRTPDVEIRLSTVPQIRVMAGGGSDWAELFDSSGDDAYEASPGRAMLSGPGFRNLLEQFEIVHAYGRSGGFDVANLFDSPANDVLVGTPQYASLSGQGFFLRANYFDRVFAYAQAGGNDVARLSDSAGSDTLVTTPSYTRLSGNGFFIRTKYFDAVYAKASAGRDTALLYDTEYSDLVEADTNWVRLTHRKPAAIIQAQAFDSVATRLSSPKDAINIAPTAITSRMSVSGPYVRRELNAQHYYDPASPTCGIQAAINALPPEGGTVTIPEGVYRLRSGLVLRSNVTLRGSGHGTVLTRDAEVVAPLAASSAKGATRVSVASTAGFRPGDEVTVFDDKMRGWYSAHAIVQQAESGQIVFTSPLESAHATGQFTLARHAGVINYFPLIRVNRVPTHAPVASVVIENLVLDGNAAANPGDWTDFTVSAIHLTNAVDSAVRNVTVRDSLGDGISIQAGANNYVENCLVEGARAHGIHLGTGVKDSRVAGNTSRQSGRNGFYFCFEVTRTVVTGNLFEENRYHGIGGLGDGGLNGDRYNLVEKNVCRRNGRHGIEAYRGADNVISDNLCRDNSQEASGQYSGISLVDTLRTQVTGNVCGDTAQPSTQRFGIEELGTSNDNRIAGNDCRDNLLGGLRLTGGRTEQTGNLGTLVRP